MEKIHISSKIGKYFLVYQTQTNKIMYYPLQGCTQKYSDTFRSKKYYIATASTYISAVDIAVKNIVVIQ